RSSSARLAAACSAPSSVLGPTAHNGGRVSRSATSRRGNIPLDGIDMGHPPFRENEWEANSCHQVRHAGGGRPPHLLPIQSHAAPLPQFPLLKVSYFVG